MCPSRSKHLMSHQDIESTVEQIKRTVALRSRSNSINEASPRGKQNNFQTVLVYNLIYVAMHRI